jgi:hypothetical protein
MTKVGSGPELSVATAGEIVELHCAAETSNPAPGFKWLRNGVEVGGRNKYQLFAPTIFTLIRHGKPIWELKIYKTIWQTIESRSGSDHKYPNPD